MFFERQKKQEFREQSAEDSIDREKSILERFRSPKARDLGFALSLVTLFAVNQVLGQEKGKTERTRKFTEHIVTPEKAPGFKVKIAGEAEGQMDNENVKFNKTEGCFVFFGDSREGGILTLGFVGEGASSTTDSVEVTSDTIEVVKGLRRAIMQFSVYNSDGSIDRIAAMEGKLGEVSHENPPTGKK
jgi:hypothetical protein